MPSSSLETCFEVVITGCDEKRAYRLAKCVNSKNIEDNIKVEVREVAK